MMSVLSALQRVLSLLVTVSTLVGAVALGAMMLHIVVDVFLKNLFLSPIPLTTKFVANYYIVSVAFFPLALAGKLDRHISVELLFHRLSAPWRRVCGVFAFIFSSTICAGVSWHLWTEAMKRAASGTFVVEQSISFPIWPSYFFLPVGFGLLALVFLSNALKALSGEFSFAQDVPTDNGMM